MRAIPQAAIRLVRIYEETHLFAYDDAHYPAKEVPPGHEVAGTLTAGTGHTGPDVHVGMTVTEAMDAAWLIEDLEVARRKLYARVGSIIDELTVNQYAALLCFVFNVGAIATWTIWKRLNEKQFDQIPLELSKFVNSGGKKSQGLVKRRNAEIVLWATNEPGTMDEHIPSSVTRVGVTDPTPSDPIPARKSKGLIIGGVGAVAGVGPLVDQARHAISPYAEHSDYVMKAIGILAAISAVCALVGLYYFYLQKKNARN